MIPAKINLTGIPEVDDATAQLAIRLRDSGMSERDAIMEAQHVRDLFMNATPALKWAYAHTGWSAHSGGYGRNPYWVARYREGKRVGIHPHNFRTLERAQETANRLNKRDGIQS